jgi:integrase/recombinase XerD
VILPERKHVRLSPSERLAFRVLVEVILGTGMRISEALWLQRSAINFEIGEARVIGKGNKERTVFFSARSLEWLKAYLARRMDTHETVFLCKGGKPMIRHTAILWFRWFWLLSGVKKKITAHVLRHTVATTLLFNGCSIGNVKEILGHERLQTTCAYYLGTDIRAAKEAYLRCLRYDMPA